MKALKSKNGISGRPEGAQAWKNWPPQQGESPLWLTGTRAVPGLLHAEGTRENVGDWALCYRSNYYAYKFIVSRDGHIAPWKIYSASDLSDGFIKIGRKTDSKGAEYNYLTGGTDPDGMPEVLLPKWLSKGIYARQDYLGDFSCKLATHVIAQNGKHLYAGWISAADGTARPLRLMKWEGGTAVPDAETKLEGVNTFEDSGFGMAYRTDAKGDNEYNWYGTDGIPVIRGEWAKNVRNFFSDKWGLLQRKEDGKWNFIGKDGKLLSDVWYKDARPFYGDENFTWVMLPEDGNQWRILKGRNEMGAADISSESIRDLDVHSFSYGVAAVKNNKDESIEWFVDGNLRSIGPYKFASVYDFSGYFMEGMWTRVRGCILPQGGRTRSSDDLNLLSRDGSLLFSADIPSCEWPYVINEETDDATKFRHIRATFKKDKKSYIFSVAPDCAAISAAGVSYGDDEALEGFQGRFDVRKFKNSRDGSVVRGFVVRDS